MEKLTKRFLPISSFVLVVFIFVYLGTHEMNLFRVVSILVTLIGYYLWFLGRKDLGLAYSLIPKAKHLVTTGIYSKIRHPLYMSQLLVLGGVISFIGEKWLLWLFFMIFLIQLYRRKKEEQILSEKFKDEYVDYMKRTWF